MRIAHSEEWAITVTNILRWKFICTNARFRLHQASQGSVAILLYHTFAVDLISTTSQPVEAEHANSWLPDVPSSIS